MEFCCRKSESNTSLNRIKKKTSNCIDPLDLDDKVVKVYK